MKIEVRGCRNMRHHLKDWAEWSKNDNQAGKRVGGSEWFILKKRLHQAAWEQVQILAKGSPGQTLEDKILQKQINEEKAETKTEPGGYVEWSEVHGVVQGEGWDWEQRLGKMWPFLYGVHNSGNNTSMDKRS